MTLARLTMYAMTAMIFGIASPAAVAQSLDYDYFKANVQPIFLKKRAGHARCVVCHAESNNAFRLQGLPATLFLDRRHRVVARILGETNLAGFDQGLRRALS